MTGRMGLRTAFRSFVAGREVPWGWTVVVVPLPVVAVLAVGSYTDDALPSLSSSFSLGWVVLLALTIVAFAGAYAATEPAPPVAVRALRPPVIRRLGGARLLGLAALFFCVYLLSVL